MNKTIATSFTTGLFLVIGLSGIMMFFHFFDSNVKGLHEILGLAFVVAVLCHLYYNWKLMKKYFTKKTFFASLIFTTIISIGFIIQSSQEGLNGKWVLVNGAMNAPTEKLYALLDIKNAEEKLRQMNFPVTKANSIQELAKLNSANPWELIKILSENKK